MGFYGLTLGILSVWRITHLLYGEDGPGDVFVRLRRAAGQSLFGQLLDCFYCLSVWIAVPFALWLGGSWQERLLLVPALSAGAIVVERLTTRNAAAYVEDSEVNDVVLPGEAKRNAEQLPAGHS
ncbi:MAG TPA: DUF1360 domain-containing protein [Thermoanaerobaculia bacterium]|nr:DUF1360 domain-containing protein [Thermoanaerobaculia bacterium]